MGLFSTKYTINVSSTLYNMAGDENDRPDFLKGTLFGSIMADSPSLADDITTSYFNGPGLKQRQFFRYAVRNNMPGLPTATVVNNVDVDPLVVAGEIPITPDPAGLKINVYGSEVNDGDFQIWIERWILQNHPDRIGEDWLGDYEPSTNTFSVEFPNNDYFLWANNVAPVFNSSKRYIVANYIEFLDSADADVVEGTPTTGVTSLPDVSGWDETQNTGTFTPVTLQRERTTVWSYNNGDPDFTHEDAVDADVSAELNTSEDIYEREVVIQQNGIELQGERQIWNFTGTDHVTNDYSSTVVTQTDLGGGVIRTETATTTGEQVTDRWTTRYDTQDIFNGAVYGGEQVFIYEVGTGNATLDALVSNADASNFQEFFPFMPIRINNVSLFEPQYETLLGKMKKGYRRAYQGKNFEDLIETVEDNDSIADIDYAYLIFGCSLNVKEQACRKYIWKFFEKMIPFQAGGSGNAMTNMQAQVDAYNQALTDLRNWENTDWSNTSWGSIPERPTIPVVSPPPTNTIILNEVPLGFDVRLQWIHIEVEQFNGNFDFNPELGGNQNTKVDDFLLTNGPDFTWEERQSYNTRDGEEERMITKTIPSMYVYWQVDSNTYRRMQIWGLTHYNYIYGGKAVVITSKEALEDNEESGFVIPLHYPTMSEMNIVDYTQMSTANAHILFNSYTVTKQRWYERGIFKILLVILVIVIAVVVFPGAFAAGGGILGGNLAVGAALGLTGTAALVAGVVANYIASILISELLKVVGTALFGEKWGAVFAAIAGFALGAAISGTKIFSAQGLLGLGNAIANGYAGWVQGDIAEMAEDLEAEGEAYEDRMDYIQDLIDGLGGNDLNFNPLFLTDSVYGNGRRGSGRGYMPETSDEFIRRTTMTGTDIVELTQSIVYDFVDVQKTLPRN